jgi:secondary thiamine-phosphate synthase enzyme
VGDNCCVIVLREFEAKTGGRFDVLDLTDEVNEVVHSSGINDGTALVFSPHTTCSVMLGSPGPALEESLVRAMEEIAPASEYYAHDDFDIRTENLQENEPANAPSHIFHIVAGRVSESIPVEAGKPVLGNGQRILFIELDGSRLRRYCIQVTGE